MKINNFHVESEDSFFRRDLGIQIRFQVQLQEMICVLTEKTQTVRIDTHLAETTLIISVGKAVSIPDIGHFDLIVIPASRHGQ